jgi:hypothetical protein
VVVDGTTYVVGLASQATSLVVSEVGGGDGGTETKILFPAGGTEVVTVAESGMATQGLGVDDGAARATQGGDAGEEGGGEEDGTENVAGGVNVKMWVVSGGVVGVSLILAMWL